MNIKDFLDDNFNLKTFLTAVLIIIIVIYSILSIGERINISKTIESTKERELFYSDIVRTEAASDIESMLTDLIFLKNVYEDKIFSLDQYEQAITEDWLHIIKVRKNYDQLRYINENGDEIIRINNRNGVQSVSSEEELQNKADRYYFIDTAKLKDDEIYLSRLDLNVENCEVEIPYIPMIRFATPLYDKTGNFRGMIIINYNCQSLLENIEKIGSAYSKDFSIINEDGYYIVNKDINKCWGFMFDDLKEETFYNDFQDEWDEISSNNPQFVSDNGIFTNMTIKVDNSSILAYNVVSNTKFSLISHIAYDSDFISDKDLGAVLVYTFRKYIPYFIIILVITVLVAVYYIKRNENFRKVKFYSEKDVLTNVYNRRMGVELLKSKIENSKKSKKNFSLCFIDINGLKQVNDILGHVSGDELIVTSANIMKNVVRKTDAVARMGGDEFIIIFDTIGEDRAEEIWQRIVDEIKKVNEMENRDYIISLSHGIVDYNMHSYLSSDDIIKLADEKMYKEKEIIKRDFKSVKKMK